MAYPKTEVAEIAIQQILSQSRKGEGEGELSIDSARVPEGEMYAELAIEEMEDEYGYDPSVYKTLRSKPAVVRYVKVSLLGKEGSLDKRFTMLADKWAKAVNREEHRSDYDANEDEYNSRRIDLYDTGK